MSHCPASGIAPRPPTLPPVCRPRKDPLAELFTVQPPRAPRRATCLPQPYRKLEHDAPRTLLTTASCGCPTNYEV